MMKLKFDANQKFQRDAIDAVVGLFNNQTLNSGDYEVSLSFLLGPAGQTPIQTEVGYGNQLVIDNTILNKNLKEIQKRNNIISTDNLKTKKRNFTVEMETGTGKTYVYLRTIFELNKQYGFKKFIIVVPSIAIREGVLKAIEMTLDHFRDLYNNVPFTYFVYDSKRVNQLRNYSSGNDMQIMIINIDAFNKKENNIIHDTRDQMGGRKPIEYIQVTNPIVILDEPQNMESQIAKDAIDSLNPLCTLRYSATHRDLYNPVYSLGPVRAFQMNLVKKICVASVLAENDPTQAYLKIDDILRDPFKVKIKFYKQSKTGPVLTTGTFKKDDNIYQKSNENSIYENGFTITEINAQPGREFVKFSNGRRLRIGQEQGGVREEIVKKQIKETIRAHFEKEWELQGKGIKVLSLFFIDRVEKYRKYTEAGHQKGKYAEWFEESYRELSEEYKKLGLTIISAEEVHNGYFSKDNKGHFKDTEGKSKSDEDTYNLIMKKKEELLDPQTPLKFIFSHSALREGWDNPNVFQICTINETQSSLKKRQEIGRGLRLPVDKNGERVFSSDINNLVVVANESYTDFVSRLQKDFEEDGIQFGYVPLDFFERRPIIIDGVEKEITHDESVQLWNYLKEKNWIDEKGYISPTFVQAVEEHTFGLPEKFRSITRDTIEHMEQHRIESHVTQYHVRKSKIREDILLDPEFEKFWNTISQRTIYSVQYSTEDLIQKTADGIKKMEKIEPLKITTSIVDVIIEQTGVKPGNLISTPKHEYLTRNTYVPDILSYIQARVELTRHTIFEILKRSGRLDDFVINPQQFMDSVVKCIQDELHQIIIDGIQYEKLSEIAYEMSRFKTEEHEKEFINDRIVPTKKSLYDYISYSSDIEKRFAEGLEALKDIKYFVKLPGWFKVPTPVGSYNPDWAILKKNGDIVYMIRETKGTKDKLELRFLEQDKIECGKKHFEAIGVDYDTATCIEDARL
jgi:type III restriction enzyme